MMSSPAEAKLEPAGGGDVRLSPAARLEGVRKRFGYRDVLRGLSLEIPRGGCFVITGPNGAGKSTLVRILATQWSYTAGKVEVLGHDTRREAARVRAHLGIVFHEPFLRKEMTLEENLRFASGLFAIPRGLQEERIARLLETFGLAHRRRDAVGTFSQGMLKRASLARSLINEPELWILDEPFSGLDPGGQELLAHSIRAFVAEGSARTVILVTHQLAIGRRLATVSARIEDGRVAQFSPGAEAMRWGGAQGDSVGSPGGAQE